VAIDFLSDGRKAEDMRGSLAEIGRKLGNRCATETVAKIVRGYL
jgi:hypothetical protein